MMRQKNSIRQIPDVWNRLKFDVAGMRLSLNGIEHDVIRKEFVELDGRLFEDSGIDWEGIVRKRGALGTAALAEIAEKAEPRREAARRAAGDAEGEGVGLQPIGRQGSGGRKV